MGKQMERGSSQKKTSAISISCVREQPDTGYWKSLLSYFATAPRIRDLEQALGFERCERGMLRKAGRPFYAVAIYGSLLLTQQMGHVAGRMKNISARPLE